MEMRLRAVVDSRRCDYRTQTVVTHAAWVVALGVPQGDCEIHQVLQICVAAPDREEHSSIGEWARMRDSGADEVE
eukprot:4886203-Pleurochrysis_carterae.AAC.1